MTIGPGDVAAFIAVVLALGVALDAVRRRRARPDVTDDPSAVWAWQGRGRRGRPWEW